MQIKRIVIRASAGDGESAEGISSDLADYCEKLRSAQPLYGVMLGNRALDIAHLGLCAAGKAAQTPSDDVTVAWGSPDPEHEVDEDDPSIWYKPDTATLMYEAEVDDGAGGKATQFFTVTFE